MFLWDILKVSWCIKSQDNGHKSQNKKGCPLKTTSAETSGRIKVTAGVKAAGEEAEEEKKQPLALKTR